MTHSRATSTCSRSPRGNADTSAFPSLQPLQAVSGTKGRRKSRPPVQVQMNYDAACMKIRREPEDDQARVRRRPGRREAAYLRWRYAVSHRFTEKKIGSRVRIRIMPRPTSTSGFQPISPSNKPFPRQFISLLLLPRRNCVGHDQWAPPCDRASTGRASGSGQRPAVTF